MDQRMTLDGPLWSVAVECQIYLFFPLLVLLRKRLNRYVTLSLWLVAVYALGVLTGYHGYSFLLFVFAEGALGADLAFRPSSRRWLIPGVALCTILVFLSFDRSKRIEQIFIGLGIALLMAYLTQVHSSIGNKFLRWKPLAWVGTFSYSLYLIHAYMVIGPARWLNLHTKIWGNTSSGAHALFLVLLIPVILLISYAFHLLFERPFMGTARQRAEKRLEPHALADLPAPLHDMIESS
jgi:peptidoglycan/LPS O-acetylase OafA/YrhL